MTAAPSSTLSSITCLNVKYSQGQPLDELPMLDDLGVRWVRDTVGWSELEPAPGQFQEFPPAFQQRLAYYRAHRIGVVFLLAYSNPTAYPPTSADPLRPVDPVAFGRYATHVARHLRDAGVPFVLEIWNEPHNFVLRSLLGGSPSGRPPAPWVDHYLRMVREVVVSVKAVDRSIEILSDEDAWVLHYRFLEAGLPPDLDGFAFHPYTKYGPERTVVGRIGEWAPPFPVADEDNSFVSAVRMLRDSGRAKLGHLPQMWATEQGWKIGDAGPLGSITEAMVADLLPRAYVLALHAGLRALCWFSAQDRVDGPMGLTNNDGRKRPAYFALRTLSRELGDYQLVRQAAGRTHPTSGLQAFVFCAHADCKVIVWSVDAAPTCVALVPALHAVAATDVQGKALASGWDRCLPVGPSPLYLSGFSPSLAGALDLEATP
jgi:hypothetical protein